MNAKVSFASKSGDREQRPRSPRRRVDLGAEALTTTGDYRLRLRNVSCTGALAQGESVPPAGRDLVLEVDGAELFCRVVWSGDGRCGLQFDEPIGQQQVVAWSQRVADGRDEVRAAMAAAGDWARPEGRSAFLD